MTKKEIIEKAKSEVNSPKDRHVIAVRSGNIRVEI